MMLNNKYVLWTFVILLALIGDGSPYALPWSFDVALIAQPFLLLGQWLKYCSNNGNLDCKCYILAVVVVLAVSYYNGHISMNQRVFGNLLLFYIGGFGGMLVYMGMAKKIAKISHLSIIEYCGRQSMFLLIGHHVIRVISEKAYSCLNPSVIENYIRLQIDFAVPSILAGVIIPVLFCKYMGNWYGVRIFKNE